jgi:hypothetical protein
VRVVAANAFVTSKLAARMAAPKIRISFSISYSFQGRYPSSTHPSANLSIREPVSGSTRRGKIIAMLLRRNNFSAPAPSLSGKMSVSAGLFGGQFC